MSTVILHISTRLILGGSQENTVLSCIGQSRSGHRVHLAYGPIFGPEGSHKETVKRFNQRVRDGLEEGATEIVLHELPNMVREIHPIKDHFCFHRDLKELMNAVQPDVVHTHSSKAGILGRWAAWTFMRKNKAHIAVVHTIHGPPFMPIEGSLVGRMKVRLKNAIYTLAERFAAKRCHVIVSVADAMTKQFLDRKIGKSSQYVTVRSGMEVEGYLNAQENEDRDSMRRELGLADDDFVIGTVARLAQHKGHDDILDGLGEELKAHPNWKLLWVGDGWWTDRLMERIRALGLEDQVVHTGLVPHARVPAMVRAMDVLLHPSYREGLPRTVPQALLCGVPVVATDTDGTPEVCLDARQNPIYGTGLLFPVGDSDALRECIRWMHERPQDRRRLGDVGRAMCSEMFSTERMIEDLQRVYEQALER
ncbi:MAG: glycosyltransferase [Phycisphaerales bacterium]|nr:glycosyltransferase [Phycisphaerales bacterium]